MPFRSPCFFTFACPPSVREHGFFVGLCNFHELTPQSGGVCASCSENKHSATILCLFVCVCVGAGGANWLRKQFCRHGTCFPITRVFSLSIVSQTVGSVMICVILDKRTICPLCATACVANVLSRGYHVAFRCRSLLPAPGCQSGLICYTGTRREVSDLRSGRAV